MSKSKTAGGESTTAKPNAARDEAYRAKISLRVWIALAALVGLLLVTAGGLLQARSQLGQVRAALLQAETRAEDAELTAKNALADKQQVIKELAAQGHRIAESSLGEEKARSALADATERAEAAEKRAEALAGEVKSLKARLATGGGGDALRGEVAALKAELGDARAQLVSMQLELDRLRAQPYGSGPRPPGGPGGRPPPR